MKPVKDENAPLTPEEEAAHRQQGGYLHALEDTLGPDGLDQLLSGPPE